jgi:hypothetical protein
MDGAVVASQQDDTLNTIEAAGVVNGAQAVIG